MGVPSFGNVRASDSGGVVVAHREYIADVFSGPGAPTTFDINSYVLNPGNSTTFPWLAPIARSFEQYKIRKMIFQFRSTSGNSVASANTGLGAVILATQYNVTDADFTSKMEMENYAHGQSGVPSQDILHMLDLKKAVSPMKTQYVRESNAPVPSGQDPRMYDFGKFAIATQGMQTATINLGELWCSYVIELIKPKIPQPDDTSQLSDHFSFNTGLVESADLQYFGLTNAGVGLLPNPGSTLGGYCWGNGISSPGRNEYRFPGYNGANRLPVGTIAQITYYYAAIGTGTVTNANIVWNLGTNWNGYQLFNGDSQGSLPMQLINGDTGRGLQGTVLTIIKANDSTQTGDFFYPSGGTLPGECSFCDMIVTLLPPSLT